MAKARLRSLRARLRYYGRGLAWSRALPQLVLDGLRGLGLRIEPYYLVLERPGAAAPDPGPDYAFAALGPGDAEAIAALSTEHGDAARLRDLMARGRRCSGVRYRGALAAVSWIDLEVCGFPGHEIFRLAADEGYLFGTHIAEAHRGRGLAPYLRIRCYQVLAGLGRTRLYSVSDRFNTPALRFKQKLGAEIAGAGLHVELFGRWRFGKPAGRP